MKPGTSCPEPASRASFPGWQDELESNGRALLEGVARQGLLDRILSGLQQVCRSGKTVEESNCCQHRRP